MNTKQLKVLIDDLLNVASDNSSEYLMENAPEETLALYVEAGHKGKKEIAESIRREPKLVAHLVNSFALIISDVGEYVETELENESESEEDDEEGSEEDWDPLTGMIVD
jgi:hypothetical protein